MASNAVEVYVKLPTGRSGRYDLLPSQELQVLCEMIAKEEKVDSKQVRLKYQGKLLNSRRTVKDYGVRVETILKAEIVIKEGLALSLSLPDGMEDEFVCTNTERISVLYEMVGEKIGMTANKFKILNGSCHLQSVSTFVELGVKNGSSLTVVVNEEKEEVKKNNTETNSKEEIAEHDKQAILSSFQTGGQRVEVVFSFDTTGSMYQYLDKVREKLKDCCTRLLRDISDIRIGLIAHGDYCDCEDEGSYVLRIADLTSEMNTVVDFANDVPKTSGGDSPECYEWVLKKAQLVDWSEDSAKALVVIGDATPHPPSYTDQNIKWRQELDVLKGMGVKVYGVQAGCDTNAEHFLAELADVTGGCLLKLSHFDIITDMFLAVCYNESNDDGLLDNFEEELDTTGQLTEQKKEMFTELRKQKETSRNAAPPSKTNRYVGSPWWDESLDEGGLPQYIYDADEDKWRPKGQRTHSHSRFTHAMPILKKLNKSKTKGRCIVM